jgi:hypothetical protein
MANERSCNLKKWRIFEPGSERSLVKCSLLMGRQSRYIKQTGFIEGSVKALLSSTRQAVEPIPDSLRQTLVGR